MAALLDAEKSIYLMMTLRVIVIVIGFGTVRVTHLNTCKI